MADSKAEKLLEKEQAFAEQLARKYEGTPEPTGTVTPPAPAWQKGQGSISALPGVPSRTSPTIEEQLEIIKKNTRDKDNKKYEDPYDYYDSRKVSGQGSNSGGYGSQYGTPRYNGYSSPQPKKFGEIVIVNEDESVFMVTAITDTNSDWWDVAAQIFPVVEASESNFWPQMFIPKALCGFKYGQVNFNACVYTATHDYLSSIFGRRLDDSDREWLKYHQFAEDGGIPTPYTPTCVQQLLEPYNMGISRIRVRKGALAYGDEYTKWQGALGVNPYAAIDNSTTNAEAVELINAQGGTLTLEQANQLWRFEFAEEPLKPGIIGEKGWSNSSSTGVQTGSGGGHSRYLAPRGHARDWAISIQILPTNEIKYLKEPEMPTYKPRHGAATMQLSETKRPDGQPVAVLVGSVYYPPEEAEARREAMKKSSPNSPKGPSSTAQTSLPLGPVGGKEPKSPSGSGSSPIQYGSPPRGTTGNQGGNTGETLASVHSYEKCTVCNEYAHASEFVPGTTICSWCLGARWANHQCPKCKTTYTKAFFPEPIHRDAQGGVTVYQCPRKSCDVEFEFTDDETGEFGPFAELGIHIEDTTGNDLTTTNEDLPELCEECGDEGGYHLEHCSKWDGRWVDKQGDEHWECMLCNESDGDHDPECDFVGRHPKEIPVSEFLAALGLDQDGDLAELPEIPDQADGTVH